MKHGVSSLLLWEGACPTPIATALENRHTDMPAGMLTVNFCELLLKPAQFTNHGEMPSNELPQTVRLAYGPLTPELEVSSVVCSSAYEFL